MRFFERLRGRSDFREESKGLGYCSKKVDLADLDAPSPSLRSALFWSVLKGSWKDTLDFRLLSIARDKETGDKLLAELNGGDIPTTGVSAVAANRQHLDRRADSELWRVRSTRDNCGAFDSTDEYECEAAARRTVAGAAPFGAARRDIEADRG